MPRRLAAVLMTAIVAACLAGCGDGNGNDDSPRPTPTATPANPSVQAAALQGTYDVTLSGDLGDSTDVVGAVFASDDALVILDVRLGSRTSLTLDGALARDGTMTITGQAETPRRSFAVEGRGFASRDTTNERLVGTVHAANSFLDFALSFTFDRRRGARVSTFTAPYRFAFSPSPSGCACDSTSTFQITVQPNGFGRLDFGGSERDAGGGEIGVFHSGECFVSPTGRLHCSLAYAPPATDPPFAAAFLFGRLPRGIDDPPISGRLEVVAPGEDVATRAGTTATRLDSVP